MSAIDVLLTIAVFAVIAGAVTRNLTSYVLLASFIVSTAMCKAGVEFNAALWMVIDTAVMMAIWRPGKSRADKAIIASFPLMVWPLYLWQPPWGRTAIDAIVAGQLFLTFPLRSIGMPFVRKAARFNRTFDPFKNLDLRGLARAVA